MGGKPRKPKPAPIPPAKSGWGSVDTLFRELGGVVAPEEKTDSMQRYVTSQRFRDKALIPKATAPDDFTISIDGLTAGRIMRVPRSNQREVWFWTVTGPSMAQAGLPSSGEQETLEGAKAAFRAAFDRWLEWALNSRRPPIWFS